MSREVAARVKETSTTTGTGAYSLAGAVANFQSFVAGVGDGNTCHYLAVDGQNWEIGLGTVTDAATDTLARTTILNSSNGGSAVDWAAGTKTISLVAAPTDFPQVAHRWLRADDMIPQTTNGAPLNTVELATNDVMIRSNDFDQTTNEFVQFLAAPPDGWDSAQGVKATFYWSHGAAASFGVDWVISAICISDDEAIDQAFGGVEDTVNAVGGTPDDLYIDEGALFVPAGYVAGDMLQFRIERDAAADTLDADARLHAVRLEFPLLNGQD